MKKIIVLLLGVALIGGVTVLLVKPKEVSEKGEQIKNGDVVKQPTEDKKPSYLHSPKATKSASDVIKDESPSEPEERLYTKEELDAAVSKAEVQMAERVLREAMSEDEITETVESVVDAFEKSNQTPESSAKQATINNYIHDNGIYDKLAEEGVIFSGVECREAACKLRFEVSDTDDNMKRRMPKMHSIATEFADFELLKEMEAIITNDFEGRNLEYYYY
ncbi:hypothetical protein [Kangiella marina]|uniref:Lipoprotein n=1 Tax=Kangiella marina TaxID=1079178 RepID=A0ABP8IJ92_9GAMM